ncbi:DUF4838 domain-containing protein [Sphingosinicella sp. BN140058]|uniref:DUF4838 domain-containing protein n=1 Tax=Sphingosinicella sp. BN140058 TaxID=1892855 RepID=UPI001010CD90|nr:DUF4838 domain-containing protein [Sphingosinicella sp. BN140058]QAY76214.1 DUF4838 domain-containing protein [Sphingosinicella sp. BN140058]
MLSRRFLLGGLLSLLPARLLAQAASRSQPLPIVTEGAARAVVVVGRDPGPWEKAAADDLVKYVKLMSGATLTVAEAAPRGAAAIVLGTAALAMDPAIGRRLAAVAKPNPLVQADAILVLRRGANLFVAGTNDESHYFAVSWLLQHWGCRWYLPTEFGEVVPERRSLTVDTLDHVHAPPFEIRHYWLAWNADSTGADLFRHRNFMSAATMVGAAQTLANYTSDIAPAGGDHFNVPFTDRPTAEHVAAKIEADYAAGKDVSLAISDGVYESPADRGLITRYDRYMLKPSVTDAMLVFYNAVADILRRKYPSSKAKIGGLAYANVTLPPDRVKRLAPNLVMWIAPIDIDPNHALDDPRSPPKREFGAMVDAWSRLAPGRLALYDYDQGMLVWRDVPNPSHHVFARDVKMYRRLGLVGFGTESRGAAATTFLNLFFRGQLMWNPDADVDALLRDFYPAFFGPAAERMARYWNRIFAAWAETKVTEHEHMALPAIYTPALVEALRGELAAAEAIPVTGRFAERLAFVRTGFDILANIVAMNSKAARDLDYAGAAAAGEAAMAARKAMRAMNPTFTLDPADSLEQGSAWLSGEIVQMKALQARAAGEKGRMLAPLPLTWSFRIEQPLAADWRYQGPLGAEAGKSFGGGEGVWREVRTDLYLQAQDILAADGQAALGRYRYRAEVDLAESAGAHLLFPGLFNEAWLFVNGALAGHRPYNEPWWRGDYGFEWDVDVAAYLRPGRNVIELVGFNPHHFAGMFRRPFLYRPS